MKKFGKELPIIMGLNTASLGINTIVLFLWNYWIGILAMVFFLFALVMFILFIIVYFTQGK